MNDYIAGNIMEGGPAWINLLWVVFGISLFVTSLMFLHSIFILIKHHKNNTQKSKFWPILLFLSVSIMPIAGLVTGWVYLFGEIITPMLNRNNQEDGMQQPEITHEDERKTADQSDLPPAAT